EHAILCDPQAVEGQNVNPAFGVGRVKAFAPSPIPGYQPQRVRAKMLVDPSGAVTAVTIVSSSGYPEIDRLLVQSIKAQHYRPALGVRPRDQVSALSFCWGGPPTCLTRAGSRRGAREAA